MCGLVVLVDVGKSVPELVQNYVTPIYQLIVSRCECEVHDKVEDVLRGSVAQDEWSYPIEKVSDIPYIPSLLWRGCINPIAGEKGILWGSR